VSKLKIDEKGCTKIIDLVGWAFQYLSESSNKASSTFLYRGYGDLDVLGAKSLVSKNAIKYIWDNYNFFIAITDCDIYVSTVQWKKST
jgi:hypothetical protein